MQLTEAHISTIGQWAESNPWALEVRLFGSRGRGDAHPESDIDLAVSTRDHGEWTGYTALHFNGTKWRRALEARLGCHVSLEGWPPTSLDDHWREQVERDAVVIWSRGK